MPGIWRARVVAVIAETGAGSKKISSGYLLDASHVLTAYHCTVDDETGQSAARLKVISAHDGAAAEVMVRESAPGLDVALLAVIGDPPWGAELQGGPVVFGRLERDRSGQVECEAAGFPRWQASGTGNFRDVGEAHGPVSLLEGAEIKRAVLRDPVLTGVTADNGPSWAGFSGAAVFHGELLVGVVIEHYPGQGTSSLQFRPIGVIADDGDDPVRRLAAALGIDRPGALRVVTAGPILAPVMEAAEVSPDTPVGTGNPPPRLPSAARSVGPTLAGTKAHANATGRGKILILVLLAGALTVAGALPVSVYLLSSAPRHSASAVGNKTTGATADPTPAHVAKPSTQATKPPTQVTKPSAHAATPPSHVTVIGVGDGPSAVAIDSATGTAYVANGGSNSVSVIDTGTNTVLGTISISASVPGSLGDDPSAVAIDSATGTAYVANLAGGSVSVIDTESNTLLGNIGVGGDSDAVAVDQVTNTAYVANQDSDSVSVINTASNTVVGSIAVGKFPAGMAVDPAAQTAYAVNLVGDSVSVIDTASNDVVASIAVGAAPNSVAIDSATGTAYVTNSGGDSVSVVNTASNTVVGRIAVGRDPDAVAVDPATGTAYVAYGDGDSVSVIDTASNDVVGRIAVGQGPAQVAVDPTGHAVYVANQGSDSVSAINTGR